MMGNYMSPLVHTNLICYTHLKCDRGPGVNTCLDWREVCDGHVDCGGKGEDETGCFNLEINECGDDEFRCYNGMCIPGSFFNDDPFNPDCLDSSDEYLFPASSIRSAGYPDCYKDPAFRCEESDHP
ncbi:unnamed protein product, partial [Rotaria sp. Silwood1]